MHPAKPISEAAKRRAEAADPNGQCCLIENCPKERAVEMVHVYARENSREPTRMRSLEWSWRMRKGTLNLDTRRNIFFLGSSMRSLYKSGKWALLPSEDIVEKYLTKPKSRYKRAMPYSRVNFPELSDATFQYTLLPLSDMSSFGITRQDGARNPPSADSFQTHVHPFDTVPTLTSHIHPNFVLLHLSRILVSRSQDPYIADLIQARPVLAKVARLSISWCAPQLPKYAKEDYTFVSAPPKTKRHIRTDVSENEGEGSSEEDSSEVSEDDGMDYPTSDGDSTSTPPRRIRYPPLPQIVLYREARLLKRTSDQLEEDDVAGERDGKRGKVPGVEDDRNDVEQPDTSERGWTKGDIDSWARGCSVSLDDPNSA